MRKKTDHELELYNWRRLCDALNFLLGDIVKGGTARRRREEDAFRIHLFQPSYDFSRENPPIPKGVLEHPLAARAHKALRSLADHASTTLKAVAPLVDHLREELEAAGTGSVLAPAYTYYTRVAGVLQQLAQRARELDPSSSLPMEELPLEDLKSLAQSFRVLLTAHDKPRRTEGIRRHVTKMLGRPPEPEEWEEALWLGVPGEEALVDLDALDQVNEYLTRQGANLVLAGQPPHLLRMSCEGKPPDPFFRALFGPFVDILTDNTKHVKVGVCANCSSIYLRRPHDTRGSTCDRHCRSALARLRREVEPDPPAD